MVKDEQFQKQILRPAKWNLQETAPAVPRHGAQEASRGAGEGQANWIAPIPAIAGTDIGLPRRQSRLPETPDALRSISVVGLIVELDLLDFEHRRWLPTLTPMREDPSTRHKDRETGSWQDWEIEHVVDKLCRDFPKKPRSAIESVIIACKETIQPSSGRERLIDCARRSLSLEA